MIKTEENNDKACTVLGFTQIRLQATDNENRSQAYAPIKCLKEHN